MIPNYFNVFFTVTAAYPVFATLGVPAISEHLKPVHRHMTMTERHNEIFTQSHSMRNVNKPQQNVNKVEIKVHEDFITQSMKGKYKKTNSAVKELIHYDTEHLGEQSAYKVILKFFAHKMQKLALKLQIPGEEEKLTKKIQKYLEILPVDHPNTDREVAEIRRQLPYHIVRKLKEMYLSPSNLHWHFNTYQMESPKYYSRYKIKGLKNILMTWVDSLTINRRVSIDETIEKQSIFNYVYEKLEPIVLDRPTLESEYKTVLQGLIRSIIDDLSKHFNIQNKGNLGLLSCIKKIISIDSDIPTSYIQPTTDDIIQLVKDEIIYFIQNADTPISTKRMDILQAKITKYLLDLTNIEVEDEYIKNKIMRLLKYICKINDDKAEFLTKVIINDYKAFFFRRHDFSTKAKLKNLHQLFCPNLEDKAGTIYGTEVKTFEQFKHMFIKEIDTWLTGLKISKLDKNTKEVVVKQLANDIIERYKCLGINHINTTDKYLEGSSQIDQEHNIKIKGRAKNILKIIKKIPKPLFVATHKSCVKHLREEIFNWFHNLPIYVENTAINCKIINNLVDDIKNVVNNKDLRSVNKKINESISKIFKGDLCDKHIDDLKKRIIATPLYKLAFLQVNLNTNYENVIGEWVETLPFCSETSNDIKNDLNQLPTEEIAKSIQIDLTSKCLRDNQTENVNCTNYYAEHSDKLAGSKEREMVEDLNAEKIKTSISEGTKELLGHKNLSTEKFQGQSKINDKLKSLVTDQTNLSLKETGGEIKSYLQHSNLLESSTRYNDTNYLIFQAVEAWLKYLPLNVIDWDCFNTLKAEFITNISYLKTSGATNNNLVQEIVNFMKTLPIEINNKLDERYFDDKAHYFLQILSDRSSDRNNQATEHDATLAVGNVIEDWIRNLPIEPLYNPEYFCLLLNELTAILTNIIKQSRCNLRENHHGDLNNNRILNNQATNKFNVTNVSVYDRTTTHSETRRKKNGKKSAKSVKIVSVKEDLNSSSVNADAKHSTIEEAGVSLGITSTRKSRLGEELSISTSTKLRSQNTKQAIFEKYQRIMKEKISELPIDTTTPESAHLAELARTGIFNGIFRTFIRLKADPEIADDHGYFELLLEDKLDEILDILPQTEQMKIFRNSWKPGVLSHIMNMLKEFQEITDRPSFRERVKDGLNRKFARKFELEQCFLMQQGFLTEMADAFILHSKYKEKDPLKANIYKQRLMKEIDNLANHLMKEHNTQFRFLKRPKLVECAMKAMESVPIPNDDILDEEVEELLIAQEIERWYRSLPISPYLNAFDEVFRKRMIELLAKKLHEIETNSVENSSQETLMKHEISKFLTERGRLETDQDLNINLMVDELSNRLKSRRLNNVTDYDVFEERKPLSSTLANFGHDDIITPLQGISTKRSLPDDFYTETRQNFKSSTSQQSSPSLSMDPNIYSPVGSYGPNLAAIQGGVQQRTSEGFSNRSGHPLPGIVTTHSSYKPVSPTSFDLGMTGTEQTNEQINNISEPWQHYIRHPSEGSFQRQSVQALRPTSAYNKSPRHSVNILQKPENSLPYITLDNKSPVIEKQNMSQARFNRPSVRFNTKTSQENSPEYDEGLNVVPETANGAYHTRLINNYPNDDWEERIYDEGKEIRRGDEQNVSQARYTRPSAKFTSYNHREYFPDYNESVTASVGSDRDGRDDYLEGDIDGIVTKCRCLERSRKRRRICINSYPCPAFRIPCMCHF